MASQTSQTFPKLLLCGVLILMAAVAIPAVVAAVGEEGGIQNDRGAERQAVSVLRTLDLTGGSRIGVSIQDIEAADASGATEGAVVNDVTVDSPAEAAGIEAGDIVVEFDGERVRSARQLTRLVGETPSGRTVTTTVVRDGSRLDLAVTPEAGGMRGVLPDFDRLNRRMRAAVDRFPGWVDSDGYVFEFPSRPGRLGIRAESVTGQLAEYFGVDGGVLVAHVSDGSVAATAGLQAGDVITAVDGTEITNVAELRRHVGDVEPDGTLSLTVMRDGATGPGDLVLTLARSRCR